MSKKSIIILRVSTIIVFIVFQIIMYFAVGEEVLIQKGTIRTMWLILTAVILILPTVIELVFRKIYKNNQRKKHQNT